MSQREHVDKMLSNLSSIDNQGLSYAILEGYIQETSDEEFNEALKIVKENMLIIQKKIEEFEDELDDGLHDEYI